MKKIIFSIVFILMLSVAASYAGLLDVIKGAGGKSDQQPQESTVVSGLKEALSIGTEKAVKSVSRPDGYFSNRMIKILMPEKIPKVADILGKAGYQKEVDEFVLSMNRAAEKAAPQAAPIFGDAIKGMSIDDAMKIRNGGNTAATEFFKRNTSDKLYSAFKPVVSSSMNEVGTARSYKEMMSKYESIPFANKQSLDLDDYVTKKALDGLFYMVGQEEQKIRTNPAARVTDLLKTVFGK